MYIRSDLKCFNLVEKREMGVTTDHTSVKFPIMLP